MKFPNKQVLLKDGTVCFLRSPGPEDAEAAVAHLKRTSEETLYLARYPEEITISEEEERKFLLRQREEEKTLRIGAFVGGALIALGSIVCVKPFIKYQHRAEFGISVQKDYWEQGIGTAILRECIAEAPSMGFDQIELEVDSANLRAVAVYRKCGFTVYGIREKAFKYKDGTYTRDYLMFLNLSSNVPTD